MMSKEGKHEDHELLKDVFVDEMRHMRNDLSGFGSKRLVEEPVHLGKRLAEGVCREVKSTKEIKPINLEAFGWLCNLWTLLPLPAPKASARMRFCAPMVTRNAGEEAHDRQSTSYG
jgi:hypothetical protein